MGAKENCEAKGGRWDEVNNRCILPKQDDRVITKASGEVQKLSREDLEEEKRKIRVQKAQQEARDTGRLSASQALEEKEKTKERMKEAAAAIGEAQPEPEPEQTPQLGVTTEDIIQIDEYGNEKVLSKGALISGEMAAELGLTSDSIRQQEGELITKGLTLGAAGSLGLGGVAAGTSATEGFLAKIFGRKPATSGAGGVVTYGGSRALGTNPRALGTNARAVNSGILKAPSQAVGLSQTLKTAAFTLIGLSGLGTAKTVTTNLLTKETERIEAEVTKVGEQLTKIPEASSLGFSLDEKGKLYEYTQAKALQDIEEVEQSLYAAERALQQAGIGQVVLKIEGKYTTAQAEIDKQKKEITVARGKVLTQIANPSESLEKTREFFRGAEFDEVR